MVETAAHLVDQVFPLVPVRQWVLSFSMRLRYFLARDAGQLNRVLQIFLNCVEKALQSCDLNAPDPARLGAVTFVHRFGSALNGNIHFHCCVIDGVFSAEGEALRFHPATVTGGAIAKGAGRGQGTNSGPIQTAQTACARGCGRDARVGS